MEKGTRRFVPLMCALALCCALLAGGQEGINSRAVEDIKAFQKKVEEGDALFNQKKYADAAHALASAHGLYQRADNRDSGTGYYKISLKPAAVPAFSYFGYGFGSNASLSFNPAGDIVGTAAGLHAASLHMWMDAAILGGLDKFPRAGAFNDPPLVEMSEEELNSVVSMLYGPVSIFKLPVPDEDWREVVFQSRRALLIVEYALQKYPEWKTGTRQWSSNNNKLQHTGDEALADIKAKLADAEPEYAKLESDFKNAPPKRAKEWMGYKIDDLNKAIAGVKKDGWISFPLARDIFISKDYVAGLRKSIASMYAEEGKSMTAESMKPIEDKVVELKSAIEQSAPKLKFPAGKPKNPTIEAKASASIKSRFPGATILKTALDSGQWIITKNDLDIPRYRSMGFLVLVKIPGQSHPWLIFGYLRQNYAGGGTYSAGGTIGEPSDIRFQAAN